MAENETMHRGHGPIRHLGRPGYSRQAPPRPALLAGANRAAMPRRAGAPTVALAPMQRLAVFGFLAVVVFRVHELLPSFILRGQASASCRGSGDHRSVRLRILLSESRCAT